MSQMPEWKAKALAKIIEERVNDIHRLFCDLNIPEVPRDRIMKAVASEPNVWFEPSGVPRLVDCLLANCVAKYLVKVVLDDPSKKGDILDTCHKLQYNELLDTWMSECKEFKAALRNLVNMVQ